MRAIFDKVVFGNKVVVADVMEADQVGNLPGTAAFSMKGGSVVSNLVKQPKLVSMHYGGRIMWVCRNGVASTWFPGRQSGGPSCSENLHHLQVEAVRNVLLLVSEENPVISIVHFQELFNVLF